MSRTAPDPRHPPLSPSPRCSPMFRTRSAAVAAILLLTLPALLVVSPAALAEEVVPVAPGVRYQLENPFTHTLYVNFPGDGNTPNCTDTPSLGLSPRRVEPPNERADCLVPVVTAGATPAGDLSGTRIFQYASPVRAFTVAGNGTVAYVHKGTVRAGMTLHVEVQSGGTSIGTGSLAITEDNDDFTDRGNVDHRIPIVFTGQASGATFAQDQPIRLILTARATSTDAGGTPLAAPTTYTISDEGSRLEITSRDAIRTATWVGDTRGGPKTLFRPLPAAPPNGTTPGDMPRIQMFFSVQSAFGIADANGPRPVFSLTRGNETIKMTPQGAPTITGEYNVTMSVPTSGVATWTLPAGQALDYRGFQAGEYAARVQARHHQDSGYSAGTTAPFLMSNQGVTLEPYRNEDPSVTLAPETLGHELPAGSETTYLLLINNTGAVNDTFRIAASFVAGTPVTGWSATVGGPSVLDRTVALAPGESKLVTVTVRAPAGAPVDSSSIFRVNATSMVDPTAVSTTLTLSSTISSAVRREVAILAPARTVQIEPGVDSTVPVYVWNRGTRVADISLDLQQTPTQGWSVDLLQGGLPTQRVILSNVPPGGLAEATLRANGPVSASAEYRVTLNATQLDASGVAFDRTLGFALQRGGGVALQILESMGSHGHLVEVQGGSGDSSPAPSLPGLPATGDCDDCEADNVTGTWFRVWVTNTGKVAETYNLTLESVDVASASGCSSQVFGGGGPGSRNFTFYARSPTGRASLDPLTHVRDLAPGATAEVYLWRAASPGALCADRDTGNDFVSFVVTARGERTGFVGTASGTAIAENAGGKQQVLLEAVGRRPMDERQSTIGPSLVDLTNASKRAVHGYVAVNESIPYRVRVTNGASWGAYLDERGNLREPRVNVYALGDMALAAGWNVSIRPILDQRDNGPIAGSANYSFTNELDGRREAWRDLELEVLVRAPSAANGTALAGHSGVFFLFAEIPGTAAKSTLQLVTTVAESADILARADTRELQAHPGRAAPSLLTVENVGSVAANVTLRVSMDASTTNAGSWRVEPAFQSFRLSAAKNRTVALLVTPPAGASPGASGLVNVVVESSPASRTNSTFQIPVTVAPAGTLDVSAPQTDATIAPAGYANFTINVHNTGNIAVQYTLTASALPEWETSIAAPSGRLAPGETRNVPYVLRAPANVEDNARFASVVRVTEDGNTANFDAQALGISILGGKGVPSVTAPLLEKRVDRGGLQAFQVEVRNTGNAAGRIPVEVRSSDPAWTVALQNERQENVTSVRLAPNELAVLNVTVRAPAVVPERTVVPIEVTASSEDFTQASRITLRAQVHDYGLSMSLSPSRIDAVPGVPSEFVVKVRNTGNDNDTINVSAHMPELRDWTVTLSTDRVPLEAGQEGEVRATVRSPASPLPSPRAYSFKMFAGTVGGAAVGLPKNESVNAAVNILPYRALDVDGDEQVELAVDADGRASNGYEVFREPFTDGFQTTVVAASLLDGKTRFFLDVPDAGVADGIADVWFDPEAVYVYEITLTPDVNNDGTPDYFLDTDRDQKIDRGYDTQTETYWNVVEVEALGKGTVQYVVDTTGDGRPDWFYDAAAKRSTRIQGVNGQGATTVGLDTDGDGKVDKYYDYQSNSVRDAAFADASGFLGKYWYFFVLFAVMLVATIALLVARRRRA